MGNFEKLLELLLLVLLVFLIIFQNRGLLEIAPNDPTAVVNEAAAKA